MPDHIESLLFFFTAMLFYEEIWSATRHTMAPFFLPITMHKDAMLSLSLLLAARCSLLCHYLGHTAKTKKQKKTRHFVVLFLFYGPFQPIHSCSLYPLLFLFPNPILALLPFFAWSFLVLGKNESWCTAVQASGGIAAKAAK